MPNINSCTYMHNHKVLNDKPNETGINSCSCRNKDTYPLPSNYQTKCTVYQANIDCDIAKYKQKYYLGSCETTFKDRLNIRNLKKLFNHVKHKNDTELSKEFWEKRNGTPKTTWKIIRICRSYNPTSKHCYLCYIYSKQFST